MDKEAFCERIHTGVNNGKSAVLFARRLYIGYRAAGDQSKLVKALGVMEEAARRDNCDVSVVTELAFLLYEMGYTKDAAEVTGALLKNKSWLKVNFPIYYAAICAIDALLKLRRSKEKAANKKFDELERFEVEGAGDKAEMSALLGAVNVRFGVMREAFGYLNSAYNAGCRSSVMYMAAYEYYLGARPEETFTRLIMPTIEWGLKQGLDISNIINANKKYICAELAPLPGLAARIYAVYPGDALLKIICGGLISSRDTSARAYYYYREAEMKQLMFDGLNKLLALSAYRNNISDISRFCMARALEDRGGLEAEAGEGAAAFLYSLLVSDDKYADVLKTRKNEIMDYAAQMLSRPDYKEAPPAVLRYFIENAGSSVDEAIMKRARDTVWDNLFTVTVTVDNNKARHILVSRKYLRSGGEYDIIGGRAEIEAWGEYEAQFFGAEYRSCLSGKEAGALFNNNVPRVDIALLKDFFEHGYYNQYMAAAALDSAACEPDGTEAKLLEAAANDSALTTAARNKARAALGAFYADIDESKAAQWYAGVDEAKLDAAQQEAMLKMFLRTRRNDRACAILLKNGEFMRESAVFAAVKALSKEEGYKDEMANLAYELLLKSRFDRQLLDLTIDRYSGSHEDWLALSSALAAINAEDLRVDERILDNAIFIRRRDAATQAVFARMVNIMGNTELTMDFMGFLAFEILVNGAKPTFEAIEAIERLFFETGDHFAAYALTAVYVGYNISSARSGEVVASAAGFAKDDGCLFPILKHIKDKNVTSAYIDRNAAFCRASEAGGEVKLYYRFDGDERFTERPMRRGRFGLWFASVPLFYGETAEYYYKETAEGGSLQTPRDNVSNFDMPTLEESADEYELINGAGLCEQMLQYASAEERVGRILAQKPPIIAELM